MVYYTIVGYCVLVSIVMKVNDIRKHTSYQAADDRYDQIGYRRCGRSGLLLPYISLGLWHNFGDTDDLNVGRDMLRCAFDNGITHFDLANNYGPPYGAAESNFGTIFKKDFLPYRDELILSTKAGWDMWPGPYGNLGSRKYLMASLDQSLQRMGVDYVDIFYSHRRDPDTPLEETMGALHSAVQQGKALYVGISQYSAADTKKASKILQKMGTPLLIHQPRYSMFDRWVENGLLRETGKRGIGVIAFSPLEQGILTDKYLNGFPKDSRAVRDGRYLKKEQITDNILSQVRKLNEIAKKRGQSLAQMAIAWLLKDERVTTVLVGVSSKKQLLENIKATEHLDFSQEELEEIENILEEK